MGHIVNPNIYRLGKMVPWVSSGFKRVTNERSQVANEDFLIYNFTRNFFYKKVYKKVIGKMKKAKLKVRRRRHVRKTKRKRKFGQMSLLNHWIIKYSHLTITRFNKTFQLNLFFFDRELQSKYRVRFRRSLQKFKAKRQRKKVVAEKKIKRLKIILQKNKMNQKKRRVLTTKVAFNGIATTIFSKGTQSLKPTVANLSLTMANDIRNFIKPQKLLNKINYTVARARKIKGVKKEKIYIHKDNTFAKNKIQNRIMESMNEITNENYKNLYFAKLVKKLYYRPWLKKYTPDFFKPQENFYIDANYFRNFAKASNRYLYYKGVSANNPKVFGLSAQMAYNNNKSYIENIRKSANSLLTRTVNNTRMTEFIERFERKTESIKMKLEARKMNAKKLIKHLKQTQMWKKHYLRMKLAFKAKKLTKRKKRRIKVKYRSAKNFAKRIMKKNKRI